MNLEQNINNTQERIITNESVQEIVSTEVISEEDKQAKLEDKAQKEKENNEQIEKLKEDILKSFNGDNIEVITQIKQGVDFVFEQTPELSQIGTPEEYSKYIENIFPQSKVRDIVYHGTHPLNKFDSFDKEKISHSSNDKAFYFAFDKEETKRYGGRLISAVVNINKPSYGGYIDISQNADGFISKSTIGVGESQQIHILGSKDDIEKFKEYISKSKQE